MNGEIEILEAAVSMAADEGPERADALNELAKALWRDALAEANEQTLQRSISTIKEAVRMSRGNAPKLSGYLNNLGLFLTDRTSLSGNTSFLDEAIATLEEGAACAPVSLRNVLLLNLGNALRTLVELRPSSAVIDRAIAVYREGLQLTPSESGKPKLLNGLAVSLLHRFNNGAERSLDDLQEAAEVAAEAINSSDDDHPYRVVFLDTYASILQTIFGHEPSTEVLDQAIEYGYMAVEIAAEQHHSKTMQLMINLADTLRLRHRIDSAGTDLDNALSILSKALTEFPGTPLLLNHGGWCYALCLLYRFERDGDGKDLQDSIRNLISVCDTTGEGSERWIQYRATLGQALIRQFDFSSSADDIDWAVGILKDVASRDSINTCRLSTLYGDLSVALLSRFELRGSLTDLNDASAAAKKALNLIEESSVDYGIAQVTYANVLLRTYQETDEEKYLNDAIELYQEAVHSGSVWASLIPGRLYTLSYALQLRFALGKEDRDEDWNNCIAAAKRAVELSKEHHTRYLHVGQLGSAYLEKARLNEGSPECTDWLNQAIKHLTAALGLMPHIHSYRALWLNNLALAYEELHKHQPASGLYDLALLRYQEAAKLETAAPVLRITAAYRAIVLLAGLRDLRRARRFVKLAIKLLPAISPRLLLREDQQDLISIFGGLGCYGAAVLLHVGDSPAEAVHALEATRGVMNSMLIDTRMDITLLEERDEMLAAEFKDITAKLDHAMSDTSSRLASPRSIVNRDPETRIAAAKAFDNVVQKVRQLDGLHDFLMAPTGEQMQAMAASSHLILVNVSSLRSDALIIDSDKIWDIHLTNLALEDTVNNANRLSKTIEEEASGKIDRLEANHIIRDILSWLWHSLVQPILSKLPQGYGIQHRICWIPASAMTNLPIHAATDSNTGSNAMDNIISSYATTIKSLLHSQQKATRLTAGSGSALFVAMQQTPSLPDLPFAIAETTSLHHLLSPFIPATLLSNPPLPSSPPITKPTILSQLPQVEILHLSCHGLSDVTNPSQSRLILPDWHASPLTVSDIAAQQNLSNGRLAYLPACHAAVGRAPELLDEGLHLAAAFQLAGFPQVVGTLWQVNDRRAMQVSGRMWRDVFSGSAHGGIRYERVAGAVNAAVRELRESTKRADGDGDGDGDDDDVDMEFEDEPFVWAPFVYMGM
ncbi:hypothetical protein CONLIGDRAFT_648022 [Coniochaeta ligniaria NRRL 30616]|uniref:CHAT domain-containing protein n=1 Tax=Coniochaeta ligniaria NRRL 30616 TaxID=1408157 RepID=A0A1J7IV07_9PEZI|nr:hypothetical protein CONLIGDRAFT_648022 [Coniochaeta ligniaria NRRL 30616]